MKIAIAQINTTVGDFQGNSDRMLRFQSLAAQKGAELVVFPELSLVGYPPRDLLSLDEFVGGAIEAFKKIVPAFSIPAIVGHIEQNTSCRGKQLFNCASLIEGGRVVHTHRKMLLPYYDVFDEERYFEPGSRAGVVEFHGTKLGMSICEDIWNDKTLWDRDMYGCDPVAEQKRDGAELIINIAASPFHRGKTDLRLRLVSSVAKRLSVPVVLANLVGGNDSLVFDGNSMFVDKTGRPCARALAFEEEVLLVDSAGPAVASQESGQDELVEVYSALVLGVRDYMTKCGFARAIVGLSGGIDSALVAAIAVEAVGPANVIGIAMPSRYSSEHSLKDARLLASNLGIRLDVVPIEPAFASFTQQLSPVFNGLPEDVTEENLQARIRGTILMAVSNKLGALVLSTGNKSEIATGYCTLYGDMVGGLSVISDVLKTDVYKLARLVNSKREIIPAMLFSKPPSAELKPNQTDQDTLPPYEILDGILRLHIEEGNGLLQIVEIGYDERLVQQVLEMIERSEYKRRQAAPGIKVSKKAFGEGRRYPIAQGFRRTA